MNFIVTFTDLQDDDSPWNNRLLVGKLQVSQVLGDLRLAQRPTMCQFTISSRGSVLVGISRDFGCVQHSREDGLPPYLMAVSRVSLAAPDELEFAVGGTMTPIDRRYLISMEQVAEVVAHFVASGELSDAVAWQEFEPS
jgi:hypothetical protein